MGLLVDGVWQDKWYDTKSNGGKFVRSESQFRNCVTADGTAGKTGKAGFKAEKDRYHLYVSLACPWAHRTLIFRKLKDLESLISLSVVDYGMYENGWEFTDENPDHLYQSQFLHQIYTKADSKYSGRVTVPILWDKQQNTIVSNESADIIRMFNSAFNDITGNSLDFYPEEKRADIDAINEEVYGAINNGVYKAGFATAQDVYEENVKALFSKLDELEERLSQQRFLVGNSITEADWRLFTTLIRFDAVYVGHFKCNIKRIADYPNLFAYVCDLYQQDGVAETINFEHIKKHYYMSHTMINPNQIVPFGPEQDFSVNHGREKMA